MSFRSRLIMAFAFATIAPLLLLGLRVRDELSNRLGAQYEARVSALARIVEEDLRRDGALVASRLATLARSLPTDDRFRLSLARGSGEDRSYVLDWGERAMRLTSLSMLQLQDVAGRILSSGHFRNEFDRLEPELPGLLASDTSLALVRARTPEGQLLALARVDSVVLGGRRYTLVGGVALDSATLSRFSRDPAMAVTLRTGSTGGQESRVAPAPDESSEGPTFTIPLGFIDTGTREPPTRTSATLVVTHSREELFLLRSQIDRWLLVTLLLSALLAVGLAAWLSSRLSRPLADLAEATAAIDLEGPAPVLRVSTERDDEIGTLARRLVAMARRLRSSASRLRDAERRATVGDMARQVNHDIKNGLIPIRNVLRHLTQVQEREPQTLAGVFAERRATLDSSLGYLDTLARNYARLTPKTELHAVDVNAIVRELAGAAIVPGSVVDRVQTKLAEPLPRVSGDPTVVRRIIDNLLRNAIESLDGKGGTVTVQTSNLDGAVRVVVADTGRGMSEEEIARAFDDFYTTKQSGTGLGLSVVRRLTADMQAALKVESMVGRGTTFTIDFPRPSALGPRP